MARCHLNQALNKEVFSELKMATVLSELSVSMSEFKKNPAAVLREAGKRVVALHNHNRPGFYIVEPALFVSTLDKLGDRDLHRKAAARLADKARAVEFGLEQL